MPGRCKAIRRSPLLAGVRPAAPLTFRTEFAVIPPEVLLGEPVPSPLIKSHDQYRFQILLRARQARQITEPLMAALASLRIPREVIVTVDVDPVNLG